MIVLVPRFGIEGIVQIESRVDEASKKEASKKFSHDETRETLTSVTDPACVLRTFDKVRARFREASLSRPRCELTYISLPHPPNLAGARPDLGRRQARAPTVTPAGHHRAEDARSFDGVISPVSRETRPLRSSWPSPKMPEASTA